MRIGYVTYRVTKTTPEMEARCEHYLIGSKRNKVCAGCAKRARCSMKLPAKVVPYRYKSREEIEKTERVAKMIEALRRRDRKEAAARKKKIKEDLNQGKD